ncbi:carotenoid biosynthesis protein [Halobacterium rubrum]|uniref:carotenoid biosynthesis protein n=1 Tax=Halobacterium TaxID=2239 RepID=UPI001F453A5D|nr:MULTISPECIES: carotenoid biosynthesis protein [Halobacterium]MDH5020945.1 carotenoid biosynthesis protein [Halobacterium rubrum]
MPNTRTFVGSVLALWAVALATAVVTWPVEATVALFAGGAVVAFLAELVVVRAGWLEHHVGPKLLGVPLYVLAGWTGTVYVAYRVALLVAEGWPAVALAAVLATAYDVATDPQGVADGHWTYHTDLGGPSYRSVPWWNFAGWLAVAATTAGLAAPFL